MTHIALISTASPKIGVLIKEWRTRRRLSQLELAADADISQRHLSFIESGRAAPSREMIQQLAEVLDIPLRERNILFLSAGFAPVFPERALDDPALKAARAAVELVLKGHMPYPALVVDRHWNLVSGNDAAQAFMHSITDPILITPPINVLRVSLHPKGMAPRIVNLAEWKHHILQGLRGQIRASGDPKLEELYKELVSYPCPASVRAPTVEESAMATVAVPLKLRAGEQVLSFISTITVFGTPVDVTLSELALETFFPADEATAQALRATAP
jgi:transcriptional regulator with XRE-family HTH domain